MNKQKSTGITLIALVITIIVLLILAGVSIAMLTGPNGLLTQASDAKTKTSEAEAKEKVQIAVAGSYGENGFDPEKFKTEVGRFKGEITSGDEEFPIKVTVDGQNFEVSEEGAVTEKGKNTGKNIEVAETLKDRLSATDGKTSVIGKKVTGIGDEGVAKDYEWQIYDVYDGNIFLIASDFVLRTDCPNSRNGSEVSEEEDYPYVPLLYGVEDDYTGHNDIKDEVKNLNKDFFDNNYECTTPAMKCVAYMLDIDVWTSKFVGNNSNVKYVIGSPSIELLLDSYNKKYGTNFGAKVFTSSDGYEYTGYDTGNKKNDGTLDTNDFVKLNAMDTDGNFDLTYVAPNKDKANEYLISSPFCSDMYDNSVFGVTSNRFCWR